MVLILDASALIAYLEKEPGYEKVKEILARASETEQKILMTSVNWGEICYVLLKHYSREEAERILNIVQTFPIEIVTVDQNLAKQAAIYKATQRLPYVDSFAAALTKLHNGELVTGDREFSVVKSEIKILWVK